jgi:hypothetical protein
LSRVLISDSRRFLFVHVQKTGGSTIDNSLTASLGDVRRIPEAHRHAPLSDLIALEPELSSYWTVGFVRNPWARLLSWWRMMERFREGAREGNERHITHLKRNKFVSSVLATHPDFESFVLGATDEHPRLRMPQVDYLTTEGRRADFIGRQESLEDDLHQVYDQLELPWTPLASVNISPGHLDYHEVYTPSSRQRVAELFEPDLRAFGYEF